MTLMRAKTISALLLLCLIGSSFLQAPFASAETTSGNVSTFDACQRNEESNCIESLSLTTSDGKEIQGILTDNILNVDYQAGAFWHAKGNIPVYEFPGMKFAYGTNTVFIRIFYWPDNSEYCAYGKCTMHNETIISYVNPYARGVDNPQFNTDVIFHMTLRVPAEFKPISSNGRARNVRIVDSGSFKTPQGVTKTRVSTFFTPIHLEQADFGSNDPTAANQAIAFEDSPALWIFGKETDPTTQMGPCVQTGGLSVYSNAVSMDMPKWNSKTQSIDIWTKSPHLTTTGEINIGYIEARIPIVMAKCLWGVSLSGKIEGKISITYDDGSPSSVVTMIGNTSFDDYLLIIAGFHFSAPTFHLVLENSMGEKPPAISLPMKTITCIKGKITKSIKGVNPACPKGYKKK